MKEMKFNFEKLDVYQKTNKFINKVYAITGNYPKDEQYGLVSQFRRAAVSISLNIAEGSARTKKEFSRYIDYARGSLYECITILDISLEQGFAGEEDACALKEDLVEIAKMLSGLKGSLQKSVAVNCELRTTN